MADELLDTIKDAAAQPRQAMVDGTQAMSHSIPDLIQLHRYNAAINASKHKTQGLRITQIRQPGTL